MVGVSSPAKAWCFLPRNSYKKDQSVDGALRLNGCLSSHQPKVWWECGKEETHCEKAYSLKRCLTNICACSHHGGNEWMWQWGERSVLAKRGRAWICSVWKTAAKQLSLQPVNRNLMSRLASLFLSLPTIPLLFLLLDHPSIFASLQKHIGGRQPEKQHSAPSCLAADKLCSVQLDGQSSQLLSVSWKEPSHLCLVWSQREGWEDIKWNTHAHTNQNGQRGHLGVFDLAVLFLMKCMSHYLQMMYFCSLQILSSFHLHWYGYLLVQLTASYSPFHLSLPLFRVHLTTAHMQVCTVIRFSQSRFVPPSELFPPTLAVDLLRSLQIEKPNTLLLLSLLAYSFRGCWTLICFFPQQLFPPLWTVICTP